jgi:hypothetical protein
VARRVVRHRRATGADLGLRRGGRHC